MIMTMSHSKSGTNNSNSNTNTNNNNNPPNHHQLTPPLSLSPLASIPPPLSSHRVNHAVTMSAFRHGARLPARVRLSDITPYDGALCGTYLKAVEALSGSLMRCNAAVIELGSNDAAIMRCGLEAARLYFRNRAGTAGKGSRGVYMYRTGRALEDSDSSPPCMAESFRCLGKAARAVLCAIARHLRLRSDVFNHLLDDNPLPANEASSSLLVATYLHAPGQNGKGAIGGGKPSSNGEFEKGLLTLISSDTPGLQVCDPNGRWYLADSDLGSGSVLLLTGKALSHATAGLRPAATYRAASDISSGSGCVGRSSLAFRLMPQSNAILDCSLTTAAGHVIPHSYAPISVSQFMDDLAAEEDTLCNHADSTFVEQNNTIKEQNNTIKEPSLRIVLSDPLSGVFLEDAMVVSCGHSFGGLMLRKVIEASRCMLCHSEIETRSLIPNLALRAAAAAVKQEDDRRLFHNAAFRKRRREIVNQIDLGRRINKEDEDTTPDIGLQRVPYPFAVNEKVVIKGNRRTPDKFVGKEAIVTSHCLNGWYLLKIVESGESVRLQYRSLRKHTQTGEERCASDPIQSSRREHNS